MAKVKEVDRKFFVEHLNNSYVYDGIKLQWRGNNRKKHTFYLRQTDHNDFTLFRRNDYNRWNDDKYYRSDNLVAFIQRQLGLRYIKKLHVTYYKHNEKAGEVIINMSVNKSLKESKND